MADLASFLQAIALRSPSAWQAPQGVTADSTYLAFLRGLGLSEADAWSTAVRNIQAIQNEYKGAGEQVRFQGQQARTNIGNEYLSRNTFRSGHRVMDLARQVAGEARQLGALDVEQANRIGSEQGDLNSRLTDLARQRIEADMGLRQRQLQRSYATVGGGRGGGGGYQPLTLADLGYGPEPAQPPTPQDQLAGMSDADRAAFSRWIVSQQQGQLPEYFRHPRTF